MRRGALGVAVRGGVVDDGVVVRGGVVGTLREGGSTLGACVRVGGDSL